MRNFFPNSFQNIQVHVFVKRRGKEEERETLANSLFYASKSKPPIQSSAFDEVANWLGNGDPEIQASSPFEFDVVAPDAYLWSSAKEAGSLQFCLTPR
ncbi:uncharacterized protein [Spinacia oleracea]|uniref:Uncharacterized protein isoform X5 n=1 Tax=Spinacia oleracea TaxID=3562 RepID=A0ABM3RAJ5_SPIOL|nr:uncharacterized protein LOC110774645 isoform X5 [Spinacia oleracea]